MRHQLILWLITPAIAALGSGWATAQGNYANAVLSDNPVAYYRLNETMLGTAADASPVAGNQNGSYIGFGTGVGTGNVGQAGPRPTDTVGGMPLLGFEMTNFAPHFNGPVAPLTRVEVADTAALDITGAITLEAWVNPDSLGTLNNGIVGKYDGSANNRAYVLFVDQQSGGAIGGPGMVISPTGTFSAATQTITATGVGEDLEIGAWSHVAATYVPDESMRLWVNGAVVEELTGPAVPDVIDSNNADLWIGTQFGTMFSANYFDGLIDEVAIYDFALDDLNEDGVIDADNRVLAHFNSAFAQVPEPTSAALWAVVAAAAGLLFVRRRRKRPEFHG